MMRVSIYIMVVALLLCAPLFSSYSHAADIASDTRMKTLRYDPNDIYTIYTLYGYQTNIEFNQNERIQTISVGDRSLWQIVPSAHRLFIRPLDDNMTTNMTVITDRRTYQFDLKSGAGKLSANPYMVYVARFSYPEKKPSPPKTVPPSMQQVIAPPPPSPMLATQAAPMKPLIALPPAAPVKTVQLERMVPPPPPPPLGSMSMPGKAGTLNYDYTYTGPDALAPAQLYDDGARTYMRFMNTNGAMPKLFALDNGAQRPIEYRQEDGMIVTSSVHSYMLLDYGHGENSRIYLYNEDRMPAGL